MAVSMGVWQRLRMQSTCERSQPRPQPTTRGTIDIYASQHIDYNHRRLCTATPAAATRIGASARKTACHRSWRHGTPRSAAVDDVSQIRRFKLTAAPSKPNVFGTPLEVVASTTHSPRHQSLSEGCQHHRCAVCATEASGAYGGDGESTKASSVPNVVT